jgi:two-component system, response regulator PdtaR
MFLSAFSDEATLAKVQELGALAYLIKPLDVGQIVPSVEAAFARLRSAAPAQPAVAAAAAPADVLAEPVPLAVGVLMHRHSLVRGAALSRLQRMADEQQLTLTAQAQRLLGAVEELARSG